jgi:2'-5' RNA ligase
MVQKSVVEQIAVLHVAAVHFIKSDLRPTGPIYNQLATVVLGESAS